jgi:hypothetical protein
MELPQTWILEMRWSPITNLRKSFSLTVPRLFFLSSFLPYLLLKSFIPFYRRFQAFLSFSRFNAFLLSWFRRFCVNVRTFFSISGRRKYLSSARHLRPSLWHIQFPSQWVSGTFCGLKRPVHIAEHSYRSSDVDRNSWCSTSTPLTSSQRDA